MTIRTNNDVLPVKRDRHGNAVRPGRGSVPALPDRHAFTLIEVLMVVAILVIAGIAAMPLISSAGDVAVQAAADVLAADLEYAKSMAMSRGQSYSVVFDIDAETYSIKDQGGAVIDHPIKKGFTYVVDFANDPRFAQVNIESVNFDSTSEIKFDYLGTPRVVAGGVEVDLVNPGVITLTRGSMTWTVSIEPVTGVITKNN
jgi:prepilin-type N-terminal cleavage/methylation domain-containing protein